MRKVLFVYIILSLFINCKGVNKKPHIYIINKVNRMQNQNEYEKAIKFIDNYISNNPNTKYKNTFMNKRKNVFDSYLNSFKIRFVKREENKVLILVKKKHKYKSLNGQDYIYVESEITESFWHVKGDKIGKDSKQRNISGNKFKDGIDRQVFFITPYKLIDVGVGNRIYEEDKLITNNNKNGKIVRIVRVEEDVDFIEIRNRFDNKLERIWRRPFLEIKEIRALEN